jgi:hypothetical protein
MTTLLVAAGCCMEIAYLSFYATDDPVSDVLLFIGVHAFCFLLLSLLLFRLDKGPQQQSNKLVWFILAFAVIFRLTLMFHSPVASDDIFRYVWDGKVSAAGMNPFAYAPTDEKLSFLRTDELPAMVNFPGMRTIYPPLAQLFFHSSNLLFGDSVQGMKFLLIVVDIGTLFLLLSLLRSIPVAGGIGRGAVPASRLFGLLLYAWSPIPIMYIALDGHIDALGIPFLLLFTMFALKGRGFLSSLSLGLSALAKLYPLFILPFLLRVFGSHKGLRLAILPLLLLVAGYAFYVEPTGGAFESLFAYNTSFEFNGALYTLVKLVTGDIMLSRVLCGLAFLGWAAVLFSRYRALPETLLLLFLGFLLCSPTAHPWYFTWLTVLLPLRWSLSTFVLLGLTNLSNIVVYRYRLTGVWEDSWVLVALEYLPFTILFLGEVVRREWLKGSAT